jgi:predicted nucleic acid-binding protein
MGVYFVDSSALVKRYVRETGTAWVRRLTHRKTGNSIYLARITAVEVAAAIARRRRGGTITPAKAASTLYRFRTHLTGRYTIIEVTPAHLTDAAKLANAHALRAYDAVQLAVAIEVDRIYQSRGSGPVTLVSADQALNAAATAEGLAVDDPNAHP